MKNWKCTIVAVAVLAFASLSVAQPTIGVYFDTEATELTASAGPSDYVPGYVMIKNAEAMIGGCAFAVDIDEDLSYFWAPETGLGLYLGDESGLELGLYTYASCFGEDAYVQVGSFTFYSSTQVVGAEISVVNHPNYTTPVIADNASLEIEATGLTSSLTLHSTPHIGVYFDEDATQYELVTNGGIGVVHKAYITVTEAEMVVGGATFKLELDSLIMIGNAAHADALVLGSLTTGVEMGLYDYLPVFDTQVGVLYELDLMTFDNVMEDAELAITNHPSYATPIVADSGAYEFAAVGDTGYLTIVVPTEDKSWGEVKDLYR